MTSDRANTHSVSWLQQPRWLFVFGSVIAAIVALMAEGPGDYIGLALLCICVATICLWSLTEWVSLYWAVAIITIATLLLGWTVEEPESALFQSVLITTAVGWKVERLSVSVGLLVMLVLLPLFGSLGPNDADWGWWNWSVGTAFTWALGRVIRLLNQALTELTQARAQLIDSAAREERLRISRDVHDLVGHSLTAMLLNIRAAQRALDTDRAEANQALADAERIGTTGIAEIRTALVDLRDNAGAESEFAEGLSSLPDGEDVQRLLQQQTHIAINTRGDVRTLKGPLAVAIYRILQECITNCSKYAPTGTAALSLNVESDQVFLQSQNDLPAGNTRSTTVSEKTLGLISMRERVASLGGEFRAGVEGELWCVHCRIPRHG